VPAATESPTAQPEPITHTIKHSLGETTIAGVPQRIVALEWTYVEDLLALGVQPVGVADIEGYNDWVKIPIALSPEAVDVGTRGEPNLETLVGLKPDLIITVAFRSTENYDELSAIAPTLAFDPYPTDDNLTQYDEMRQTFLTIADVVDRRTEGEAVLATMEQKFAEAEARLEAEGLTGQKFVLSQAWSYDGNIGLRLFTDNGMATQIVEQIGLENGWEGGFQQYGFSDATIETLPTLGDTRFFYVVQSDDPLLSLDTVKPVWDSLEFVKNGHAYPLGGDTWLFGGPLSAEAVVNIVVSALTQGES
jgi:iron complex transport system substrate-binding protein